jgi:hypothetical protein
LCLLCLFVASSIGCSNQSATGLTVAAQITPRPARVGQATVTLLVTDATGALVNGVRIKLEGNMSHAGMTPEFADAAEFEPGRYRANMNLPMAGDWIVLVHLTLADGTKVERQFDIKGVAPA